MSRTQRFAQYVQQLAHVNFVEPEERDERPDDVLPRADEDRSHYGAWNATSFSSYVPFRGPTSS